MGANRRRRRSRRGRWARTLAAALALGAPVVAAAQQPNPLSAPRLPLLVELREEGAPMDAEALRQAIEAEVQSWVVMVAPGTSSAVPAPRVTIDLGGGRGELVVRYDQPGRRPLVRTLATAPEPLAAIPTIAWLVGNLVRDQVSDLLAPLQSPPARVLAAAPASPPPPASLLAAPAPVATAASVPPPVVDDGYAPVTASLFFPLATNGDNARIRTRVSLNLLYGRIGTLDRGLQLGMANDVMGKADGAQLGLVFNHAGGDIRGFQVAPGFNTTGGSVSGYQVALAANVAAGDVDGFQIAGVNSARGRVRGAQAGVVNAAGDVDGLQAGLVNVGRRVRGVQLGLVNVSDDIEGAPIGIINVSRTGGVHAVLWASGAVGWAAGVKFSTRHVYSLLSGSSNSETGLRRYGPGFAFGFRVPLDRLVLETDAGAAFLFAGPLTGVSRHDGLKDDLAVLSWRVLAGLQLHRWFTVFAGAGLATRVHFYQTVDQNVSYDAGPDLFAGVQL